MRIPHDLPMRALTDEQEQAVARREGSLLLAAGAGSGKTSVLVERFVRAVREDGVAPGRILAITFTERAAGELRERVRARLLELGEREAARDAEAANVGTFHGFCARLLRIHPLQAGVEPGFQILEEGFADRLRALAFSDALAGFLDGERSQAVDLVAAYGADPLRSMVLGAYAQLRSQGQSEPRLPSPRLQAPPAVVEPREPAPTDELGVRAAQACELIGELVERFGTAYGQRKHVRAALDFDDLELNARDLLEQREGVREAWAERFQLLMVDEFQDSNPRQLQVLAALDRDNLFTVGDELQSIYGFRHADVSLFRERHAHLSKRGASFALTRNFRSRPAILAAVERIFATRIGERFAPLTPTRTPQTGEQPIVELLLTDRRGWERFPGDDELEGMPDATPWRQAEARLLAGRVAELIASGHAQAGEIVVLLRALGDLPVYESALRHQGLRTLAGVGGFWSHQQVGDLLAWLRALANPLDELALYSTLASPLVGVSSDGLALIARAASEGRVGVWRAIERAFADIQREGDEGELGDQGGGERARGAMGLRDALPPADRERVAAFRELFASERASAALHPISELLRRVIAATGYDAHVLSLSWGERRLANVQKLVRLARRFEAREGRDLRRFLDHVAHVEAALGGREADAPVGDGELDAVRLMSIHAAKGLEFPVVCVGDLGRDPNLRVPDLLLDGAGGRVGLRLLELGNPEAASVLDYDELREERREAQEEEEDRVLYVACTRAENRLLLSGSVAFERWPAPKPGVAPIAWLAPALVPDASKLAASGALPTGGLTVDAGGGLMVRCVFNASSAAEQARPVRAPEPVGEATQRSVSAPTARLPTVGGGVPAPTAQLAMTMPTAPRGAPAPLPLADPDATMSYTSLAELERCGYRYYLERVLRLPENRAAARSGRDDGGIEARTRGTIVHVLLESVDFARPQPPSVKDVEGVARQIGASVGAGEREEIAALIAGALTAEPARRLRTARRARSEHPFAFSLEPAHSAHPGEPLVTGVLDLIVEQPDGSSLIVDYKSDRLAGDEDLEQLVQRNYGFQRLLYALAAIEDGAHEVEVAHWFLERPEEWVAARFAGDEQHRLREQLLARVARVRTKGFAVTGAPHRAICLTCPGRGGLCSWGETRTMSERSATLEFDG
jgi:ATP-dependent exoDNAse (exonuclease V) beta subunit